MIVDISDPKNVSRFFFLCLIGGGDGTESHDLLPAGCGWRCELAAGGRGGRDEGEEEGGVLN